MLDLISAQVVEIVVGVIVGLIVLGGFGIYIGYRVWAKKHGKSACDGNCAHCSGCHINLPIEKGSFPDTFFKDGQNGKEDIKENADKENKKSE